MENVTWKLVPGPLNLQRNLCKKVSEEVCVLIWTNLDSFANTYLSSLLQKFRFPIEAVLLCKLNKAWN